ASDLAWAPGNLQKGQLGDIPYSDKIAFMDKRGGKDYLTVFASRDDGSAVTERPMASEHGRHWWSPDSSLLAITERDPQNGKRILLGLEFDPAVFESGGERLFHFRPMTI